MEKTDIASLLPDELTELLVQMGQPRYRAAQLYRWIHKELVTDFDKMTDLPVALRENLHYNFVICHCDIEKKLISCYDDTVKYLFRLHDGELIEAVVMKYKYGRSICISSQVGCKMGCAFCASALNGCTRSLAVSELLGQVYAAQRDLGERISHIVMMGMGEPLDNFDATVKFLRMISDEKGLCIGMRNISVSTCGIVPKIYELAALKTGVTLSVSLHAADDAERSALMPVNRRWGIDELLRAVRHYIRETGRRVSFEYTLVRGANDSPEDAERLARLLSGMLCHVNLIPVNEVKETGLRPSSGSSVKNFQSILERRGLTVTVRRTLGADINASCGQLRRSYSTKTT